MTLPCKSCGGNGYGTIVPAEGWVAGPSCPDCLKRFEKAQAKAKVKLTYGPPPKPPRAAKKATAQYVDDPSRPVSNPEDLGQPGEAFFPAEQVRRTGGGKRLK